MKQQKNNHFSLAGKITNVRYEHEIRGEKFYYLELETARDSGYIDTIPALVSGLLLDDPKDCIGKRIHIEGQYRSRNIKEGGVSHLKLYAFAQELTFITSETSDKNEIYLDGFVCKEPIFRETPMGRRITDLCVALNRPYGVSDYIPCIVWGRNAKRAAGFKAGEKIRICGRIQSRIYQKRTDGKLEERIAYEVSAASITRSTK